MKKIILPLLILSTIFCRGQVDSVKLGTLSGYGTISGATYVAIPLDSTSGPYVFVDIDDSTVSISGDTTKALKMLGKSILESMNREDSLERLLHDFIRASVDFSNCVPDYFRSKEGNNKWMRYKKYLTLFGYIEMKRKNPDADCCRPKKKKK